MFGRQASSLSRTGTLLLLMEALVSVRLTWSASMASDGFGNLANLNPSIFGSFRSHGKHLGDNDSNVVTIPPVTCLMANINEGLTCLNKTVLKLDDISNLQEVTCKKAAAGFACDIKVICKYCTGDDYEKVMKAEEMTMKLDTDGVCKKWASSFPSASCTSAGSQTSASNASNKTLWIILAVVGAVIVVIVVIGVVMCCCCMGGGRSRSRHNNRKSSKHSLKGGSKSKIRKASSKHRASSKLRASSRASSRPTSRASSRR